MLHLLGSKFKKLVAKLILNRPTIMHLYRVRSVQAQAKAKDLEVQELKNTQSLK